MTGWSRVVRRPSELAEALAAPRTDPADVLDLRAAGDPGPDWPGFRTLVPGELVRPLPVPLPSVTATRALGARLAHDLRAGDLVLLSGPLGAGKTALTQGLGGALGVRGAVTSPTFVLERVHRGDPPMVHVDVYRLRQDGTGAASPDDLADLDLETHLAHAVVVVEWGAGVVEDLAESWVRVELDRPASGSRSATVHAHGPRWATPPRSLAAG